MFLEEKRIRPGWAEEDLWIDLSILSFLREELLSGNLDFVLLRDAYKQGFFSDIDCSWERFRRRAFYQVGLGYVDVHPIRLDEPEVCEAPSVEHPHNHKSSKGYLPPLRIAPAGFMRIPVIETELKKYEGINRYITPLREQFQRLREMKWAAVASVTVVLVLSIFVFDIKVSKIIQGIPILGSVIDTQLLQEFEAVNENDEFYQALMTDDEGSSTPASDSSAQNTASTGSSISSGGSRVENILDRIPPVVKRSLPVNVRIVDMKVKTMSDTERMFRITLENGVTRDIRVEKVGERYRIENQDGSAIRPAIRK